MNVLQNALKELQMNPPFGGASIGNIMYKMITLLLVVFITGCSTPRMSSSLSMKNATVMFLGQVALMSNFICPTQGELLHLYLMMVCPLSLER